MKKAVWAGIAVNFLLAAAINIIYFNQQINLLLIGVGREENIKKSGLGICDFYFRNSSCVVCKSHPCPRDHHR